MNPDLKWTFIIIIWFIMAEMENVWNLLYFRMDVDLCADS